jgi:hypothetical protein
VNALHELLAAVVPDVTERETELVIQMLNARPGVQSGSAVLPREIRDGNGPALVAEVRQRAGRPPGPAPSGDLRPAAVPYRDMCSWCSRPGHDADNCPDRRQLSAPDRPARPLPAVVETPCAAGDKCQRADESVPGGHEYHLRCKIAADLHAALPPVKRADRDEANRNEAAEQVSKSRAVRTSPEGGHAA